MLLVMVDWFDVDVVTLASAMICFQSFFAFFVRAFARKLLSMNEYGMFQKKEKIKN
jgi:hypothetical protein